MAYLNFKNYLINTENIYYIDTNPLNVITITTDDKTFQPNKKEWNDQEEKIIKSSNFMKVENYGYLNLDLIKEIWRIEKGDYLIKYKKDLKNLRLNQNNTPGINDDFFENIKNYTKSNGGGGSGGDFEYSNSTPMPKELGGYPKGTTFTNKTSKEMWDGLLYPYIAPSVTALSTPKTQLEIGDTLTSPLSVTWNTSEQNKITNTAIYFDNTLLEENLNASGTKSFAITPVQLMAQGSKTIKCEITDEKSSKYSKTTNINWVNLYYLGNSTKETLTEDDVKTFNKFNGNGISSEFTIDGSGYKYICYPKAWGIFKYMDKDSKFDISMKDPEVINLTNGFGVMQEFYVHRTSQSIGGSLTFVKQ